MANVYIFYSVVGEFSYWKKSSLIILLIIDKNSKISFYYTVLFFSLAINLKIIGGKKFLLDC